MLIINILCLGYRTASYFEFCSDFKMILSFYSIESTNTLCLSMFDCVSDLLGITFMDVIILVSNVEMIAYHSIVLAGG